MKIIRIFQDLIDQISNVDIKEEDHSLIPISEAKVGRPRKYFIEEQRREAAR